MDFKLSTPNCDSCSGDTKLNMALEYVAPPPTQSPSLKVLFPGADCGCSSVPASPSNNGTVDWDHIAFKPDCLKDCDTLIQTIQTYAPLYVLPAASTSTLGGIKVGTNLAIDGAGALTVNSGSFIQNQNSAAQTANYWITGISKASIYQAVGNISAVAGYATGNSYTNRMIATANNDILLAADFQPTYTLGSFTGVKGYALRATNLVLGSGTDFPNQANVTGTLNIINPLGTGISIKATGPTTSSALLFVNSANGAVGMNVDHTNKIMSLTEGGNGYQIKISPSIGAGKGFQIYYGYGTAGLYSSYVNWPTGGDASSRWGFNNSAPSYTIDVTGNGRFSDVLTVSGHVMIGSATDNGAMLQVTPVSLTTDGLVFTNASGTTAKSIKFIYAGVEYASINAYGAAIFNCGGNSSGAVGLVVNNAGGQIFKISGDENFAFGATSGAGYMSITRSATSDGRVFYMPNAGNLYFSTNTGKILFGTTADTGISGYKTQVINGFYISATVGQPVANAVMNYANNTLSWTSNTPQTARGIFTGFQSTLKVSYSTQSNISTVTDTTIHTSNLSHLLLESLNVNVCTVEQVTKLRTISAQGVLVQVNGNSARGASVSHVSGIQVWAPRADTTTATPDTNITNYYGLVLNDSTESSNVTITNRWGIYQEGASDKNKFFGLVTVANDVEITGAGKGLILTDTSNGNRYRIQSTAGALTMTLI